MGHSIDSDSRGDEAENLGPAPEHGNAEAMPSAQNDRTKRILADADRRDDVATARDRVSDERANAADLLAFVDTTKTYPGHRERREAALDRSHSKRDRESSADDRARLTEDVDATDPEAD